ncbi:hypothetical protein ACWEWK_18730 [Streptomyces sp. NPDC003757]
MGWGARPGAETVRGTRAGEWSRAAALCAGQLPVLWLAWWFVTVAGTDDYGYGGGGYLGIICVPVVLPFLGLAHATVQIMPAVALSRLVPHRLWEPEWAWRLVGSAAVGACWFALGHAVWGWSLAVLPWFAGAGVLPVLGLAALRRRTWGAWRSWLLSAVAGFLLFVTVVPIGEVLVDDYEPPRLSAARVAGDWHGAHGSVLRLDPGGEARLTRLPVQAGDAEEGDLSLCDGSGTWTFERDDEFMDTDRDGVLLHVDGACGGRTYWTIGGTEQDPELFVSFGDPDGGDLRILTRD